MLNDPAIVFTTTPQNVMKYVDFMVKIGSIKVQAGFVEGPVLPERARICREADAAMGATDTSAGSARDRRRSRGDPRGARAHRAARPPHAGADLRGRSTRRRARRCSSSARICRRSARSRRAARATPCSRSPTPKPRAASSRIRRATTARHSPMRRARRGIPAWVVMPDNAPTVKQANVRGFGATVRFCAPTLAAREAACAAVAARDRRDADSSVTTIGASSPGRGPPRSSCSSRSPRSRRRHRAGAAAAACCPGTAIARAGRAAPAIRVYGAEPAGADDAARVAAQRAASCRRPIRDDRRRPAHDARRRRRFAVLRAHVDGDRHVQRGGDRAGDAA